MEKLFKSSVSLLSRFSGERSPLFAKNSRLGYFLNATLRRFSQSKFHFDFEDDLRLLRIKFAKANLAL
jgi:hypothetical protein